MGVPPPSTIPPEIRRTSGSHLPSRPRSHEAALDTSSSRHPHGDARGCDRAPANGHNRRLQHRCARPCPVLHMGAGLAPQVSAPVELQPTSKRCCAFKVPLSLDYLSLILARWSLSSRATPPLRLARYPRSELLEPRRHRDLPDIHHHPSQSPQN